MVKMFLLSLYLFDIVSTSKNSHASKMLGIVGICVKAAYSVTFDLLILELMFLFFKNTVKTKIQVKFYQFRKS